MPTPYTALDAATFVERHARPQPEEDGAFFAITRTDTGEVLGSISFDHIDWAFGVAEVGYWVAPRRPRRGRGHGALVSLVEWGRRELRLVEVRLQVLRRERGVAAGGRAGRASRRRASTARRRRAAGVRAAAWSADGVS